MNAKVIGAQRATLASEVRREIERMIDDGELAAGEKMNELSLSAAMGVSRGTVREAIRSLADSGLIDLIANRGAFVHETTSDEVRNLYELRGAIFSMACSAAAREVASGAAPNIPKLLANNMKKMEKAQQNDDVESYYALNIEYHDLLLEAANNQKAKAVYDSIVKEMHLFRRRGLSIATNIARSLEEHAAITDAVAKGDTETARAAAHAHVTLGFERYSKMLEQETSDAG